MTASEQCEPVDLSNEADFSFGRMQVRPSLREVTLANRRENLEPRVMQVLVALAHKRGETVSRDELLRRCWEGRAVGDDAMNRCISRLRKLADEGGFAIEAIPRIGYRLSEDLPAPPIPDAPKRWYRRRAVLPVAIALSALLLAGFLLWPTPAKLPVHAAPPERVAVLPFEALSVDKDAQLFGKAVAEQIVAVLNDSQVLAIAPKRGGAAAADYVLDGSVRRDAAGLHATVHISRTATGATLWTGQFDQETDDPATLQMRIASHAVDQMAAALKARRSDRTLNDAALAAYLAAQENARIGGREATMIRHDMMRKVVAQVPGFSLGHSGLALSAAQLSLFVAPGDSVPLRDEARREAKRALDIDPTNGEAYLALSILAESLAEEETLCRKGLAVEPDEPTLNSNLSALLGTVGRTEEALALQQRAAILAPLSSRKASALATLQALTGHLAAAVATAERAFAQTPNLTSVWSTRLFILTYAGKYAEARALLERMRSASAQVPTAAFDVLHSYLEATASDTTEAKAAALRALKAALASHALDPQIWLAEIAARLGDIDAAYAIAETCYFPDGKDGRLKTHYDPNTAELMQPALAAFRRDPRFLPLMQRLGLVAYWTEHQGPDFCRNEDVPICRELARQRKGRTR